jgi:hypothetical protein
VVRLAALFSRGVKLETTALLPLYLPPRQYRYVVDSGLETAPRPDRNTPRENVPAVARVPRHGA